MLSKSEFERNEDTEGDQMVAVYRIDEGQCCPCQHRWTRITYKWDGYNYKKIRSEETQEELNISPCVDGEGPCITFSAILCNLVVVEFSCIWIG